MFEKLPPVPDHPALERGILELWEREGTFELLREKNRGGPRFSFMDGPITANNPMGVHHLGRALKDVFQRYKALRGFETRYQNGFDSQGLHVEVEVEKSLGLNSKREIETYGLAEFAAKCRERVAHYAGVMTDQSKRLGMWMDWGNDYFTFSDTNIEYIWRFLKEVHRRGWLYKGHRSTQWCPRCGTSLSKHEQAGEENYKELEHPSLEVRFPLHGRAGRVARRLDDDAVDAAGERRSRRQARRRVRAPRRRGLGRGRAVSGRALRREGQGRGARRASLPGPVRPPSGAGRRRAPRHPLGRGVAGRGNGDRPHRAGLRRRGLRALTRVRLGGADADRRVGPDAPRLRRPGGTDHRGGAVPGDRVAARAGATGLGRVDRAPLSRLLALLDTARLPRGRRLVHLRAGDPAADAGRERDGRMDASAIQEAHGRLAAQHGRLEHFAPPLLRAPAAVLSLRVRPLQRDRLAGRAGGAGGSRARPAPGAAPALDRRGADPL